ncbi:MAG: hypothetical protein NUV78_03245, partial [Candidatus Zambryskibacteria bacterium]|nr:hypothetical protein [Candidatus Zambryskibacteria bacterium]
MKMYKEKLLANLIKHIAHIQERINENLKVTQEQADMDVHKIARMRPEDQMVAMQIKGNAMQRVEDLRRLIGSPYFIKCEVILQRTGEKKTYYFAKHHFSEERIYSWFSPVSTIRFEAPGEVSYKLPNGEIQTLTL